MSTDVQARERPILFSRPMVRAILDGRKTQTRRVVKVQPRDGAHSPKVRPSQFYDDGRRPIWTWMAGEGSSAFAIADQHCPYGQPGDRLWVRESWAWLDWCYQGSYAYVPPEEPRYPPYYDAPSGHRHTVVHRAGTENNAWGMSGEPRWRPSIHMPRTASRLTLELTDVRVEQVHKISEEDARAEGVDPVGMRVPGVSDGFEHRMAFGVLWDELNEKRGFGWNANPWVWALTFKVLA